MSSEDLSSLPGRLPPAELRAGLKTWFRRTLTQGDVAMFIGATWDINPLHTDDVYASHSRFGRRIVPSLFVGSQLTHLGGLWGFLATSASWRRSFPARRSRPRGRLSSSTRTANGCSSSARAGTRRGRPSSMAWSKGSRARSPREVVPGKAERRAVPSHRQFALDRIALVVG